MAERKLPDDEIDPRREFYLGFVDFRRATDGGWMIEAGDLCNGNQIAQDLDVVEREAIDAAEDHGAETIVYRCIPIKRYSPKRRYKVELLDGSKPNGPPEGTQP